MDNQTPRRWRMKLEPEEQHRIGRSGDYAYGCYFPQTDLCVDDMGNRRTGVPKNVEWLDEPTELMKRIMFE